MGLGLRLFRLLQQQRVDRFLVRPKVRLWGWLARKAKRRYDVVIVRLDYYAVLEVVGIWVM